MSANMEKYITGSEEWDPKMEKGVDTMRLCVKSLLKILQEVEILEK
jgi:hypothetical protein